MKENGQDMNDCCIVHLTRILTVNDARAGEELMIRGRWKGCPMIYECIKPTSRAHSVHGKRERYNAHLRIDRPESNRLEGRLLMASSVGYVERGAGLQTI